MQALSWMSRSPEATSEPADARMAMVASPMAPEAAKANQRTRRNPFQGALASASSRSRNSGSKGVDLDWGLGRGEGMGREPGEPLNANFIKLPV